MTEPFVCWKCGAPILDEPWPWPRLAQCRGCGAELHVCRLCVHYAPRLSRKCREERAEELTNRESANFCDYFEPVMNAFQRPDPAGERAKSALDALFGGGGGEEPPVVTEAERARQELERLFGG